MHNADPKISAADVDSILGVTFPELRVAVQKVVDMLCLEARDIESGEAQPAAPETA